MAGPEVQVDFCDFGAGRQCEKAKAANEAAMGPGSSLYGTFVELIDVNRAKSVE